MKALIVDDSLVIRNIIENGIKPLGYAVLHAGNGKEALDILDQHAQDVSLVLLDWNMPILNGYETVVEIRKRTSCNHISILMISTESEDEKIGAAIAAGAHDYLAKPFTADELAAKIGGIQKKSASKKGS